MVRVNPVELPDGYRGRGTDAHVTRCVALFADIDIKNGGVADAEAAETITKAIDEALGQPSAAVVFSGHGGHPYWLTDPDDDAWTLDTEAKRIAARRSIGGFIGCAPTSPTVSAAASITWASSAGFCGCRARSTARTPPTRYPVGLHVHPFGRAGR